MTIFLEVSALLLASVAIGWLVGVNKRVSDLGMRVLESEDVGKILDAANKTAFFESRVSACEDGANKSHKQLTEHETKLGELAANLGATERLANGNGAGRAELSEKTASLESRMAGCENTIEQSENKLSEHESKVNELIARLEAVDRMLNEHAAGLAEVCENMKALADGIQSLEVFQTATEKTHSLIVAAFNDMQTDTPAAECLEINLDSANTEGEGDSPEPQEAHQESESLIDSW